MIFMSLSILLLPKVKSQKYYTEKIINTTLENITDFIILLLEYLQVQCHHQNIQESLSCWSSSASTTL